MNEVKLYSLIKLLEKSLSDRENLYENMMKFEDMVGNNEIIEATEQQKFLMTELGLDIAYFSNIPANAAEDPSLFGESKMLELIRDTLKEVS